MSHQPIHLKKAWYVFAIVSSVHVAMLWILSLHGKWIKPSQDIQPLTVSFITERATANAANTHVIKNSQSKAAQKPRIPKRNTKNHQHTAQSMNVSTQKKNTHISVDNMPMSKTGPKKPQQKKPNKPKMQEAHQKTQDVASPLPLTQPKKTPNHRNELTNTQKQANKLGVTKPAPFSKHLASQENATGHRIKKTSKNNNLSHIFDEAELANKSILDGLDDVLDKKEIGNNQSQSKQRSNWGKLSSPEDSHIEALYKNKVKAIYPEEEKAIEREGIVVFEFRIDHQGKAIADSINVVNATSSHFLREAKRALLASEFEVSISDGLIHHEYAKISITFSLDEIDDTDIHDELGL